MDVLLMLSHNLAATCAHFIASVSKQSSQIVWYLKATQNNFEVNEWQALGFSTELQALPKLSLKFDWVNCGYLIIMWIAWK